MRWLTRRQAGVASRSARLRPISRGGRVPLRGALHGGNRRDRGFARELLRSILIARRIGHSATRSRTGELSSRGALHRPHAHVAAIAVAGALGALARYGSRVHQPPRPGRVPWGTFVVNISGSFALGLVFTLATERWALAPWLRSGITIGFLGAYTTFSTCHVRDLPPDRGSRARARGREHRSASCAAGLVAVYLGVVAGDGRCDPPRGRRQARPDLHRRVRHLAREAALPGDRRARPRGGARRRDGRSRGIEGFGAELAPPHLADPPALRGPAAS